MLFERKSFRNQKGLARQKKVKKVGRPRPPKGFAKGKIVPVRCAPDATKAIEAAANARGQTSDWVRTVIQTLLTSQELVEESAQLYRQSCDLVAGSRKKQAKARSK